MQEEDIRKMLDKLKELSPYSQDIAFLYNKYKEEYQTLSEFKPPKGVLDEFKRKLGRALELAERYKKRYEYLESVKNEFEKHGVRFLVFVTPFDHEVGVRVVSLKDIRNPFVSGEYFKVDMSSVMEKVTEYEKFGKLAICKPIDYRVYECEVDDEIVVLDYS